MKLNIDRSDWRKVRLGDVATAPSIRISNPAESGFDRFIGNANIGRWDFRLTSWEPTDSVTSAMKGFESGDYLFVRRSLYASDFRERSPRATFAGVCSGDIITIREDPAQISDGFLIAVLNSPDIWKYVVANASGSITRRIKWRDLANYEFLLPSKDQQTKLAKLLWAADHLVESNKDIINRMTIQKRSLQKRCFQIQNRNPIRLKALASVLGGFAVKSGDFTDDGLPVIKIKNIVDGRIEIDDKHNHVSVSYVDRKTQKFVLAEGDILVAMTGATLGKVGRVQQEFHGALLNQRVGKFVIKDPNLDNYIYAFVQSAFFLNQVFKYIGEGAQGNVSAEDISKVLLPDASEDERLHYAEEFRRIDSTISEVKRNAIDSGNLLKSLINQIF